MTARITRCKSCGHTLPARETMIVQLEWEDGMKQTAYGCPKCRSVSQWDDVKDAKTGITKYLRYNPWLTEPTSKKTASGNPQAGPGENEWTT